MKLAQFKTKDSAPAAPGNLNRRCRLRCGRAGSRRQSAGGNPPDWLLEVTDTLEVIKRGSSALEAISSLLGRSQALGGGGQGHCHTNSIPSSFFPPFIRAKFSRLAAITRNTPRKAEQSCRKAPLLFNKLPNALSAHNAPIVLPIISEQVDFEAELAVIIGRATPVVSAKPKRSNTFSVIHLSMTSVPAICNSAMVNGRAARASTHLRRWGHSSPRVMRSKTCRR